MCEICSHENVCCKHYVKQAGEPVSEEKTEFRCVIHSSGYGRGVSGSHTDQFRVF